MSNRDGEYDDAAEDDQASSASEHVALVEAPIGRESAGDEVPDVQDAELRSF